MSTIRNTAGTELNVPAAATPDFRVAVVVAEWNDDITGALAQGAHDTLLQAGVLEQHICRVDVPGTVELVQGARRAIQVQHPDAVIVIGCVIRGDTPHFDYVCQIAAQGTAMLNAQGDVPVIFGVLTVDNEEQARERAGGRLGNKGAEAAVAALRMGQLLR